jgi:hypothetical protein
MRRVLFPLALVGIILAGALLGSEGLFRMVRLVTCVPSLGGDLYRPDDTLGWAHRPGADVTLRGCNGRDQEFYAHVEINAEGLRDVPTPLKAAGSRRRILVLGDSITEAVQVDFEQTFVELLERKLTTTERPVDVINAAVAGYGTDNSLVYYETMGRNYDVDEVLLVLNYNDIAENLPMLYEAGWDMMQRNPKPAFFLEPDDSLRRVWLKAEGIPESVEVSPLRLWLLRNFYALRTLDRYRRGELRLGSEEKKFRPAPVTGIFVKPSTAVWARAWRLSHHLLAELDRQVQKDGRKFRVAIFPARGAVTDKGWYRERAVVERLQGHKWNWLAYEEKAALILKHIGIETIALGPALRSAHSEQTPLFFDVDVHMNPAGHAVTADTLAEALAVGSP